MHYDFKKQIRSFGYAWKGIRCVVVAGHFFHITRMEWIAVLLCIGMVIGAEMFNSAVERIVDLVSPQRHPLAGQIKDIAAGAVLVCALTAMIVGLIIFVPYLTRFFL